MAIALAAVAFGSLVALHVVSPEFAPSWRVVSEYALGRHAWLLSTMFLAWGLSTWAVAAALWSQVHTRSGRGGLWVLLIAGLGQAMASVFDVTHMGGHALAGILGVLGFPIAAVLVSTSLDHTAAWSAVSKRLRHWCAHFTWVSVLLLIGTLALLTVQMTHANGGTLPRHAPTALPAGVIGLDGWADRLIVLSSLAWTLVVALEAMAVQRSSVTAA